VYFRTVTKEHIKLGKKVKKAGTIEKMKGGEFEGGVQKV
jgi:hypothetical protein